jgi:hypothetical protein
MILCGKCGKEFAATKTGEIVRWRDSYCKAGDRYAPACECAHGAGVVFVGDKQEGWDKPGPLPGAFEVDSFEASR